MDKRQFFKTGFMGIGALLVSGKLKALEFYPTSSEKKMGCSLFNMVWLVA